MKIVAPVLIALFFMFITGKAVAQNIPASVQADSTKIYKIELLDGSVFIGNILLRDSATVVIKTASIPKIDIPATRIKSVEEVESTRLKKDVYWFPNPNATRYLFGPSAFNLKKGEGYYQNTYLVLNSFNVGVTNNISVGGGIELISTFTSIAMGSFKPIFFITPKAGFKVSNKFHAGGGFIYASVPTFDSGNERDGLGIVYGIGTYSTLDHNITGGLGWGFFSGELSSEPIFTLSGMTRVSKKVALVSENWIVPVDGYMGLYSYGVRFFGEKMAVDLAFINNPDIAEGLIIGIPYVDFVIKF